MQDLSAFSLFIRASASRYMLKKKQVSKHYDSNNQVRQKIMYSDYIDRATEIEEDICSSNDAICNSKKGVPDIRVSVNDVKHSECETGQAAQPSD